MAIERILVIRLGAMGDLVHAASAVQAIKRQYPTVQVDWLTSPPYIELLRAFESDGLPLLSQVLAYDKRAGLKGFLDTAIAIRKRRYDGIINLHTSFKTWLLCRIALMRSEGCYFQYWKEKLSVQGEGQREMPRRHAVEDFLQPFSELFPGADTLGLKWVLPPSVAVLPAMKTRMALVIGVGQKRCSRGWPIEHYQRLIDLLLAQTDASIALIGGPEEVASGTRLENLYVGNDLAKERVENYCGKLSLLETASVLKGANVVIGGDTGPLHLASCFNVPIIGIFGPTSVHRTGVLGPKEMRRHLLPHPGLSCWPCELPTCPLPAEQYLACMKETMPEAVMSAVMETLSQN